MIKMMVKTNINGNKMGRRRRVILKSKINLSMVFLQVGLLVGRVVVCGVECAIQMINGELAALFDCPDEDEGEDEGKEDEAEDEANEG
jgi:hypothetical protein